MYIPIEYGFAAIAVFVALFTWFFFWPAEKNTWRFNVAIGGFSFSAGMFVFQLFIWAIMTAKTVGGMV
jgi:hypothetical protein